MGLALPSLPGRDTFDRLQEIKIAIETPGRKKIKDRGDSKRIVHHAPGCHRLDDMVAHPLCAGACEADLVVIFTRDHPRIELNRWQAVRQIAGGGAKSETCWAVEILQGDEIAGLIDKLAAMVRWRELTTRPIRGRRCSASQARSRIPPSNG